MKKIGITKYYYTFTMILFSAIEGDVFLIRRASVFVF